MDVDIEELRKNKSILEKELKKVANYMKECKDKGDYDNLLYARIDYSNLIEKILEVDVKLNKEELKLVQSKLKNKNENKKENKKTVSTNNPHEYVINNSGLIDNNKQENKEYIDNIYIDLRNMKIKIDNKEYDYKVYSNKKKIEILNDCSSYRRRDIRKIAKAFDINIFKRLNDKQRSLYLEALRDSKNNELPFCETINCMEINTRLLFEEEKNIRNMIKNSKVIADVQEKSFLTKILNKINKIFKKDKVKMISQTKDEKISNVKRENYIYELMVDKIKYTSKTTLGEIKKQNNERELI